MYIECEIVMLPTNDITKIEQNIHTLKLGRFIGFVDENDRLRYVPNHELSYNEFQHIHFLSNERIKNEDWCFDFRFGGKVFKAENNFDYLNKSPDFKKIFATTDESLVIMKEITIGQKEHKHKIPIGKPLPKPSSLLIETFIEKYNQGTKVQNIMLKKEIDGSNHITEFIYFKPVPVVNSTYVFFDDGKIYESRKDEVLVTEIIPFNEIDDENLAMWKIEVENCPWLFLEETDFFVKGTLKNGKHDLIFTRTKDGGWFDFCNYLWGGRLDIDGALSAPLKK